MFTDIQFNGWVEHVPEKWRPYVHLARMDRPIGVWLLLLPGLWSIALASGGLMGLGFHGVWLMILFGIGAVAMRGAGCVINDLWDRDLDGQVERTSQRPLPSGRVNMKQAFLFLLGLLVIGLIILLQMNGTTVLLGFVSLPLVIAYPLMKRFTYWPQAFLGLTFNFGALMGWSAVTEGLALPALLLYAGGICWTIGFDTVYAHQDKEDDALIGVKSTALKFGEHSKHIVGGFYAMAGFFFTAAVYLASESLTAGGIMLCVSVALYAQQLLNWDMDDQESCLRVFKSNRNFGLAVLGVTLISGFF